VRTVVTGRVFHRGEDLVIGVELTDVGRGSQIWGEQYRRRTADIFDIQEEISREISQKLWLKLSGEEHRRLTKRHTDDQKAYRTYLKGRYCWNQRTADGLRRAVDHFREAIDLDPTYALAYCGLGDALSMRGIYQHLAPKDAFPRAVAAARRALSIDAGLSEAHATLGFAAMYHDWNAQEAERELQEALRLDPANPSAHQWLGMVFALTGRFEQAIAESAMAQQHDPFSASINTTRAWPWYWTRRTDEALRQLNEAMALHPHYWTAAYFSGLVLAQKGDWDAAVGALEKAQELSDSAWSVEGLGHVYARAGRTADAERVLGRIEQLSSTQYVSPYSYAVVHAGLGSFDAAFTWLERAVADRSWRVAWLPVDPLLDSLREHPRFPLLQTRAMAPLRSDLSKG
jgi:tetratricopeptide (TPR) repeat protein